MTAPRGDEGPPVWLVRLCIVLFIVLILALSRPCYGQGATLPQASDRFAWSPPHRDLANGMSYATAGIQITLDTIHSLRGEHRTRDLWRQACSEGVAHGATWIAKKVVHQERPDGSDDNAFWSGHSATAAAAAGWRWSVGIPLTIGTGYLRIAAAKHDWIDVAAGAGVGVGSIYLCRAVIK